MRFCFGMSYFFNFLIVSLNLFLNHFHHYHWTIGKPMKTKLSGYFMLVGSGRFRRFWTFKELTVLKKECTCSPRLLSPTSDLQLRLCFLMNEEDFYQSNLLQMSHLFLCLLFSILGFSLINNIILYHSLYVTLIEYK